MGDIRQKGGEACDRIAGEAVFDPTLLASNTFEIDLRLIYLRKETFRLTAIA
jgi:hypothetical protein